MGHYSYAPLKLKEILEHLSFRRAEAHSIREITRSKYAHWSVKNSC